MKVSQFWQDLSSSFSRCVYCCTIIASSACFSTQSFIKERSDPSIWRWSVWTAWSMTHRSECVKLSRTEQTVQKTHFSFCVKDTPSDLTLLAETEHSRLTLYLRNRCHLNISCVCLFYQREIWKNCFWAPDKSCIINLQYRHEPAVIWGTVSIQTAAVHALYTHTDTHTHTLSLSLSLSHTHTHSHSETHTHTQSLSLSHTHTQSFEERLSFSSHWGHHCLFPWVSAAHYLQTDRSVSHCTLHSCAVRSDQEVFGFISAILSCMNSFLHVWWGCGSTVVCVHSSRSEENTSSVASWLRRTDLIRPTKMYKRVRLYKF